MTIFFEIFTKFWAGFNGRSGKFQFVRIFTLFRLGFNKFHKKWNKKNFSLDSFSIYFTKITNMKNFTFHFVSLWNNISFDSISKWNKINFTLFRVENQKNMKLIYFRYEIELKYGEINIFHCEI